MAPRHRGLPYRHKLSFSCSLGRRRVSTTANGSSQNRGKFDQGRILHDSLNAPSLTPGITPYARCHSLARFTSPTMGCSESSWGNPTRSARQFGDHFCTPTTNWGQVHQVASHLTGDCLLCKSLCMTPTTNWGQVLHTSHAPCEKMTATTNWGQVLCLGTVLPVQSYMYSRVCIGHSCLF